MDLQRKTGGNEMKESLQNNPIILYNNLPKRQKIMIKRIQSVLSPNLLILNHKIDTTVNNFIQLTRGHCYAANEAAYYSFARDLGYVPFCGKTEEGMNHWWLKNEITNMIIDITFPSILSSVIYDAGQRKAFLTNHPSKRALEILRRINEEFR
jgi:hypothetical protein